MDLAISYTFTAVGSGTLAHGTFDSKPKGVMAVLLPLLLPMIRRDMARQHQHFKALCESQEQSPSTQFSPPAPEVSDGRRCGTRLGKHDTQDLTAVRLGVNHPARRTARLIVGREDRPVVTGYAWCG